MSWEGGKGVCVGGEAGGGGGELAGKAGKGGR